SYQTLYRRRLFFTRGVSFRSRAQQYYDLPRASAAHSAARMRCGVAGTSSIETPNGDSASLIALSTAAGAPIAPPSPNPFALVTDACVSVAKWWISIAGTSRAVGGR